MNLRAAVDAQGKISAWEFLARTLPWTEAQGTPQLGERHLGQNSTAPLPGNPVGSGASVPSYEIANQKIIGSYVPWPQENPTPLRTNPLRSPGEPGGVFAAECFVDEIASDLRIDPIQFRLSHLRGEGGKRVSEALRTVAQKAAWAERASPAQPSSDNVALGRGVAVSTRVGTVVAIVAEVAVDKSTGQVSVKRVVVAHDCGLVVNPDGLKFQVDGNVIHARQLAGKPAPDTFLTAAKLLGVEPSRAVVIEDALSGVEAGSAGGFGLVIGVARKGNAEELRRHGAHLVVNDLGELAD